MGVSLGSTGFRGASFAHHLGDKGTALVADQGTSAVTTTELIRTVEAGGWVCVLADDVGRLRWLASVRSFAVIVLRGSSLSWTSEAITTVREVTVAPVLAMTPNLDRVHSHLLDAGADLVLEASCHAKLLHSAINAAMRKGPSRVPVLRYLEAEALRLDVWSQQAYVDGNRIELTRTEFRILQLLMTRAQTAVRHHEIIKLIWNWTYSDERNALRLQINRLRAKICPRGGEPDRIRSVRGIGYSFTGSVSQFASTRPESESDAGSESNERLLQDDLRNITKLITGAKGWEAASRAVVDVVVQEGLCDSSAVFARKLDQLTLVAQVGMSQAWETSVSEGVPLGGRYLASHTVNTGQTIHYVDISSAAQRLSSSARLLRTEQLSSHLSVPLAGRSVVWGQIGFGRRGDSPFTPVHHMVLETAAAMLGAVYAQELGAYEAQWTN